MEKAIEDDSRISLHPVTDTVADFYRLADCLLLTSLNEVTPMVICEAFSYGLPVLSTNIAGIKEMVSDGVEGYLFAPGDNAKAIASMDKLVKDDALRHDMGKRALSCFWRTFELTLMVQRYRELLLDLAPPLILIDMDGTLVDYETGFGKVWCNKFPIHREKSWHIEACVDTPEAVAEIEAITHAKGFFLNLPPMAGAIKALAEMEAAGLALMVCSTPISSPYCAQEKIDWIAKHLGVHWIPRLVLTHTKNLIKGDILIDDKPFAHKKIKQVDPTVINAEWRQVIFDAPYNRSHSEAPRLYRWRDWRSILCPLIGRAVDFHGKIFNSTSVGVRNSTSVSSTVPTSVAHISSSPSSLSSATFSSSTPLPSKAADFDVGYRKTLGVDCLDCQSGEHRSIFPAPSPSSVIPCDFDAFSDISNSLSLSSSLVEGDCNGGTCSSDNVNAWNANGNGIGHGNGNGSGREDLMSKEARARARLGMSSLACLQSASDIFGMDRGMGMGKASKTLPGEKTIARASLGFSEASDSDHKSHDKVTESSVASNMDDLTYIP